ncbi:MAG: VWA domain-containing protein [Bryobacteraceae bacterium]|nr:VWA domain-containing protein [Bryobacteraceae bacterium]
MPNFTRRDLFALSALASGTSLLTAADNKDSKKAPVIVDALKISVNEVIVPVTVVNEKGKFVNDLDQKDFELYDEGKLQEITYFNRDRQQPVVVGFLIDQSNVQRLHWPKFLEASQELVVSLLPGDDPRFAGYLVTYSNEAELKANTTSDPEKLLEKIRKLKPGGGAALFDALYMACTSRNLVKGEPVEPRRVVVIVGDGHDNASKKTLEEVLELAQRNLVTVYGVSTVAFGFAAEGEKNLTRLCEETGGRVVYPLQGVYKDVSGFLSTPSDEGNYALKVGTGGYASAIAQGLFRAVSDTMGEITTQYIMRYVPGETDSKKTFRKIEVKVPRYPNVTIRARKGYYPYNP